jgi:hypothetical protein
LKERAREESLKRRIEHGTIPDQSQTLSIERNELPVFNDDGGNGLYDPIYEDRNKRIERPWSDLEKCIFLDKFLQYPKNFKKIAEFLSNKCVKDCVRFYYDSKKDIDYKGLLREHQQRRRGIKVSWQEIIKAAANFGAVMHADHDNNVYFALPPDENTYATMHRHPPHFPSSLKDNQQNQRDMSLSDPSNDFVAPLLYPPPEFIKQQKKMMKASNSNNNNASGSVKKVNASSINVSSSGTGGGGGGVGGTGSGGNASQLDDDQPAKRAVQKWNQKEKELFLQYFMSYGKDWAKITSLIPTKSEAQVKNYYQNYKSRLGLNEKRPLQGGTTTTTTMVGASVTSPTPPTATNNNNSNNKYSTNNSTSNHMNSASLNEERKRKAVTQVPSQTGGSLPSAPSSAGRLPPHSPPTSLSSAPPHTTNSRFTGTNNSHGSVSPFAVRQSNISSDGSSTLKRSHGETLQGGSGGGGSLVASTSSDGEGASDILLSAISSSSGKVNNSNATAATTAGGLGGFMPSSDWLSGDVDWRSALPAMMSLNAMGRGVLSLSGMSVVGVYIYILIVDSYTLTHSNCV